VDSVSTDVVVCCLVLEHIARLEPIFTAAPRLLSLTLAKKRSD
jgi:hypothetical protein